jgi:putative acetyltransferase
MAKSQIQFQTNPNCPPDAFQALFQDTFTASESPDEGRLIGHLAKQLALDSRTDNHAIIDEHHGIRASAFTSPLTNENGVNALLLAPVAVHPDNQGQGLARWLIESIVQSIKGNGCDILITYGDPALYGRFGFEGISPEVARPPYPLQFPEGWQAIIFTDKGRLSANYQCAKPFLNADLW